MKRTSRIAVFNRVSEPFQLREVRIPELREGEVLVRIEYTTLCRSDLTTYVGKRTEKTPTILGHEIAGTIEEMGAGAPERDARGDPLKVGDRITWGIYASDPEGPMARIGIPQKGKDLFKYGHEELTEGSSLHGGLAEHCILRKHTPIVKIRKPVPLPVVALINCSASTAAGALRVAGEVQDRNVLVSGAGMLGLFACAMSRAAGARHVLALDINEERLKMALRFGADSTFLVEDPEGFSADTVRQVLGGEVLHKVMDFSGVPETMEEGLKLLGIGGTAVWIGATFPQRDLLINAEAVIRNLHTIRGLHNYNESDLVSAVTFIESAYAVYPLEELIHDRFRLDTINEAFRYGVEANPFRVGVRIEKASENEPKS